MLRQPRLHRRPHRLHGKAQAGVYRHLICEAAVGETRMFRATKDIKLPTTITGSLPRPSWYTENLGTRHFLEAMVGRRFREQYEDALTCYLRDQELAGLDILTDGDCRFDDDVGGQSW